MLFESKDFAFWLEHILMMMMDQDVKLVVIYRYKC